MESARIQPEPAPRGQKSGVVLQDDADWPEFDRIPHFVSARRRLPPDQPVLHVPADRAVLVELVLAALAGVCAGALFVLILIWRVLP